MYTMLARNPVSVKSQETKTTSKTSSLKALLLKAWRERWSDLQWGINIKTVLPRGVSGDVYDLADCILQQAVIGSGANQLVLSYLRHSLSAQLVSYSAVLQQISKCGAKQYSKPHCIASLLEFLEAIQPGITCRAKPEESSLATALLNISLWLLNVLHYNFSNFQANTNLINQNELIEKPCTILNTFVQGEFFISMLYLAKFDNPEIYADIQIKCQEIEALLASGSCPKPTTPIDNILKTFSNLNIDIIFPDQTKPEPVTYCIQSLLTVEVHCNPCSDIKNIISQLLMLKRIKGYSNPRLYCELIRACLMSLSNASGTTRESQWGAYTFLKVPHILQQLTNLNKSSDGEREYSQDIVDAFEMLLQYTPLLDIMDIKCSCNCLECLINELAKLKLVSEKHVKYFSAKRDGILNNLQKLDSNSTSRASIPKVIIRAEPTLSGILKTLNTEPGKIQEALLNMLHQVLTGKSFELILAVATVEGKLKTFVSKLIKFNEYSKQPMNSPETSKTAQSRAMLFDISFLMLCSIVQTYGSKVVLDENGDSFFEQWVRSSMVEPNLPKSPDLMLKLCDQTKVDQLIKQFNSPDAVADFKNGQTKWHEVCLNIPGVIKEILFAWERGSISATDVKRVLDILRGGKSSSWSGGCCSLAVCASSWLCAHVRLVHHDALLKPMNIVQQLGCNVTTFQGNNGNNTPNSSLTNSSGSGEDINQHQDNFKERSLLMSQIIRKFQCYDINPPGGSTKSKHTSSINPTVVQLRQMFSEMCARGSIINIDATSNLENLLNMGGSRWFVYSVVQEMLKLKYIEHLNKAVDLAFSIFHLDIEKCTIALLTEVLPIYLLNCSQAETLVEPQSSTLAKLCVYCIVATIEYHNCNNQTFNSNSKKRSRQDIDSEEDSSSPASKLLRLNDSSTTDTNLSLASAIKDASGGGSNSSDTTKSVGGTNNDQNGTNTNNTNFTNGSSINNIVSSAILNSSNNGTGGNGKYGPVVFSTNKSSSSNSSRRNNDCLKEPLLSSLTNLYRDFLSILTRDCHISYETYFVFQYVKACVLYGKDLASIILQNMPSNLIPNLLKCLPELFSYDLLLHIYDLSTSKGTFMCNSNRDLVARDLCLLRNIELKRYSLLHNKNMKKN